LCTQDIHTYARYLPDADMVGSRLNYFQRTTVLTTVVISPFVLRTVRILLKSIAQTQRVSYMQGSSLSVQPTYDLNT